MFLILKAHANIFNHKQRMYKTYTAIFMLIWVLWLLPITQGCQAQNNPISSKIKEYYPNGKTKVKGHFKNGNKHGNWFYYAENGLLQKRERYTNGILKATFNYNSKGLLINMVNKNGKIINKKACGCG
jgi:hypothetical protein